MNLITYKYLKNTDIAVYLDGKKVGTIKQYAFGCRYTPKGYLAKSDLTTYRTLFECKRAIEGND